MAWLGSKRDGWLEFVSVALYVCAYLVQALRTAASTPLWEDEILAIWAARASSPAQIAHVLAHGVQLAPPAFSVFLHYYAQIAGYTPLALRLPALAAALATCVCTYALVRRHQSVEAGVFAAAHLLLVLSFFALQVRPYTMVAFCYAAALLLWCGLEEGRRGWRAAGIGLLLAVAVALHFYAVLLVPVVGLIELWRSCSTRSLRPHVWGALVCAGASIFLWSFIMVPTRRFTMEDVLGSTVFGLWPAPEKLLLSYLYLFLGAPARGSVRVLGEPGLLLLLCISSAVLITLWRRLRGQHAPLQDREIDSADRHRETHRAVIGSLYIPLVIFAFAVFISKAYTIRYMVAGGIGASALLAEALLRSAIARRALPAALALMSLVFVFVGVPANREFDHTRIYPAIPGRDPIVIADGRQFFNLVYAAPPAFRARIVYLTLPPQVPIADAINAHLIERCKSVFPQLPVEDANVFLAQHRSFWVLDEHTADDTPALHLLARHAIAPWVTIDGATIYRSASAAAPPPR